MKQPRQRRSLATAEENRVDLVILSGRWVAIYTGPHAWRVMEATPDGSCMVDLPLPADRTADEAIAYQRTLTPAPMPITADAS